MEEMNSMQNFPLLSAVMFLPLVGAALLWGGKRSVETAKRTAFGVAFLNFLLSLSLLNYFQFGISRMQLVEKHAWVSSLNIHYFLGVDGISLLLVLLTTLMTPLAILATWHTEKEWVRGYLFALLFLETAVLGVFLALDLVLFYIFWEAMLIPLYFLIGIWGGEKRRYATLKFIIYTLAGSVLMLVGILSLYFAGGRTFDLLELSNQGFSFPFQFWVFLTFFLAFAVKAPLFPFHTWLPSAYVQSPAATTVILAAVVSKTGIYGFIRFCLTLFPDASMALGPVIFVLSVITILYGGFLAFAQTDYKLLVAYSSFSHMGFMTLGIFAFNSQGVEGAILQTVNHGVSTGALFLCVAMIYGRVRSHEIGDCIGIGQRMPVYISLLTLFAFSSLGLPGTNTFVGEFLILVGAVKKDLIVGAIAIPGVALTAAYLLRLVQRMAYRGETSPPLADLSFREVAALAPLVVLVFWIGLNPAPFLDVIRPSVDHLLGTLNATQTAGMAPMEWMRSLDGKVVERTLR